MVGIEPQADKAATWIRHTKIAAGLDFGLNDVAVQQKSRSSGAYQSSSFVHYLPL
jgi:hypothetical protein